MALGLRPDNRKIPSRDAAKNFRLIEKYPHYVFNFTGANRYRVIKEYYPDDYARLKKYVEAGRWFPAGSSMEESDVNAPSAESIIRQILYGRKYFLKEFGSNSAEYTLPDCFGFPASLPSILAHMGLKGFSTQKLGWGSSARVGGPNSPQKTPLGMPFHVGVWEGPDGKGVIAAFRPGAFTNSVNYDLSQPLTEYERRFRQIDWLERIALLGKTSGLYADYIYYGTGDEGGSPDEASVNMMEALLTKSTIAPPDLYRLYRVPEPHPPARPAVKVGNGPVAIVGGRSDQMFLDITGAQRARLPRFNGELELKNHSAGSFTSQAYTKLWNRRNEVLAEAAEGASVAADWLGGLPYPLSRLNDAWTLVAATQFHDILPGTSIPKAYEYSWNDQILAMNQFLAVTNSAVSAVASALDTRVPGVAVVVYNPLNIAREDVVGARLEFPDGVPPAVRVIGSDGKQVPAQLSAGNTVLFVARAPSIGFAVYSVQQAEASIGSKLTATQHKLENARYRVHLNRYGDVESIFDKRLNRELLIEPIRLAISTDKPTAFPAWNMDFEDQSRQPRAQVGDTGIKQPVRRADPPIPEPLPEIRIVENGPVCVALQVIRKCEGSTFAQAVRLSAGDAGDRVEFSEVIDWKTPAANLKVVFPLTAVNPVATYNWDIGTIERSTNEPRKFEVPSHQWFDLTDKSGAFGVTVLSDCKLGSDKPDDNTLRLTLLRTPGIGETWEARQYPDQATQDWGRHEILFGLTAHAGDWRKAQVYWDGLRLNQPMLAFQSPVHAGPLGKSFSFLNVSSPQLRLLAVKRAEDTDEIVIRVVEMNGQRVPEARLRFVAPVASARETNGAEEPVGMATAVGNELVTSFSPYQIRTFAVKLRKPAARPMIPKWKAVDLPYNQRVASRDGSANQAAFDSSGRSLPVEMLLSRLPYGGISFELPSAEKPNAVVARGQSIALPAGTYNHIYVLAAAEGDQKARFSVGRQITELTIGDWGGYIGQWDNRIWKKTQVAAKPGERPQMIEEYAGLVPGFIKPASVAWFASHHHTADGRNVPYAYSYLFAYEWAIPANSTSLTLPDNDKIRILAVTVAEQQQPVRLAQWLYDMRPSALR